MISGTLTAETRNVERETIEDQAKVKLRDLLEQLQAHYSLNMCTKYSALSFIIVHISTPSRKLGKPCPRR
jgi:hypothetical protein